MLNFTTTKESFTNAISYVISAVSRQNLPVLEFLLFEFKSEGVTVTASDMEIELSHVFTPSECNTTSGAILLPAKKLQQIISSAPDGCSITVTQQSEINFQIKFSGTKTKMTLKGLNPADFPKIDVKENKVIASIAINPQSMFMALKETHYAMANQDVRYYMNGLCLSAMANEKYIELCATDGHRLANTKVETDSQNNAFESIVPRKGILELISVLSKVDSDQNITITVTSNHLFFNTGNGTFITKLIDGKYPDWRRIVPNNQKTYFVDRNNFRSAIERARILSNEKSKGGTFVFEPNRLKLNAHNSQQENAFEEIDINGTDPDSLEIGFNLDYLSQTLACIDESNLVISLESPDASALLSSGDTGKAIHVIMPMRC